MCLLSSGAGRRLFSATDTEEVGDGEGETDASVQKESGMTIYNRMGPRRKPFMNSIKLQLNA